MQRDCQLNVDERDWHLRTRACAKVNLGLQILGRTPDGYHDIRSVMLGLDLADEIHIRARGNATTARPHIAFTLSGGESDIPRDERNLAVRAACMMTEVLPLSEGDTFWPPCLEVHLSKHVPSQAGLGGGSADAAAVLRLLGRLPGRLPMADERLHELAARLGSDVPFMVLGGAALAEGRGERLRRLRAPQSWWCVLVQPPERISTAWCYQRYDELALEKGSADAADASSISALVTALERGDLAGVGAHLCNDLQRPVFERYAHLRRIPQVLRDAGCAGALMTGSGSCFFGLAGTRAAARRAAAEARSAGLGQVWITRTWREGA